MGLNEPSALDDRLRYAITQGKKPVVFLVGAPLSAAMGDRAGVPDVKGMIQLIVAELYSSPSERQACIERWNQHENPYQASFADLFARRGQDFANRIVRTGVLQAHSAGLTAAPDCEESCQKLDEQGWNLPPAVAALGQLVSAYPQRLSTVLTSNFDTLIEIAIRRCAGHSYSSFFDSDGGWNTTDARGCRIVHLHGCWHRGNTLHFQSQLQQARPRLTQQLERLIDESLIVVMAYGGWDDIFTKTLRQVLKRDDATPEIIWTFRSDDPKQIDGSRLKTWLRPGVQRGTVTLFGGVDCHDYLPKLAERLAPLPTTVPRASTVDTASVVQTSLPGMQPAPSSGGGPPPLSSHARYARECLSKSAVQPFVARLEARLLELVPDRRAARATTLVDWTCELQDEGVIRRVLHLIRIVATKDLAGGLNRDTLDEIQEAVLALFWLTISRAVATEIRSTGVEAASEYLVFIPEPGSDAQDSQADRQMVCQIVAAIVALALQGKPLKVVEARHLAIPNPKEVHHLVCAPLNGERSLQALERAAHTTAVLRQGRPENKRSSTRDNQESRELSKDETDRLEFHIEASSLDETIAFVFSGATKDVAHAFATKWKVATMLPSTADAGEILRVDANKLFLHVQEFWKDWCAVVNRILGQV